MLQSELFPENKAITRRDAARICHEYVRDVLGEEDEIDISRAAILKDLYDCGVCVNHIAQVYLKGLMEPERADFFGMNSILTQEEAKTIAKRIADSSLRTKPAEMKAEIGYIPLADIMSLQPAKIVDVRTKREYEEAHFGGSVNIPLSKYVLNPLALGNDKFVPYVFICTEGANAEIAACCALKAGFYKVFYSSYEKK